MAAYLLCISAGGGIPLFTRIKGEIKQLPFPVIGSLNGVHMFGNNHGVHLQSTITADSKIVWKTYHDSIVLIIVSRDDRTGDPYLGNLLDKIFHSMVLLYGLDDLVNIKNVERFKREIKISYKLIDMLLEQTDSPLFCDMTDSVDFMLGQENTILQTYLDAFVESANSPYGCLLVHNKVTVATKKWWGLTPMELVLLSLLVSSLPKCSSRDIPIFLPHGSPKVPHRLLTFQLAQGVDVCVICGPSPQLADLDKEIGRFWRSSYESLKAMTRLHPHNIPDSIHVDQSILGFILIDREHNKCLCTVHPHEEDSRKQGKTLSTQKRKEVLRSLYKLTVGSQLNTEGTQNNSPKQPKSQAKESYLCCESHKSYTSLSSQYQFFVLFSNSLPAYAMRPVTQKLLDSIVRDKNFLPLH